MNKLPLVSIIIPVYNVRDYIEDCLRSVIAQDYDGQIECIVVDDCGTDDTIDVVQRFITTQCSPIKFRIIHHEHNRKQSAARNTGLQASQGEYISFIDSDDWIDPSYISAMVKCMNEYPESDMVVAGTKCMDQHLYQWMDCATWKEKNTRYTDNQQWIIDTCSIKMGMIPMMPFSKLIKRSFLFDNQLFFLEGIYYEDDLWLVNLARTLQRVSFVHQNLYYYRVRMDSTVGGGMIIHYTDLQRVWMETFKLFDQGFCPPLMLRQIEWDTTNLLKKTKEWKWRKMLISIKFRLMHYCPLRFKLRIIKRLIILSLDSKSL